MNSHPPVTYYISPTGSDRNIGSVSEPFKTIQKAADIVDPGDTVVAQDGIYTDTDGDGRIVNLTRGGVASKWIIFRAENKWGAVLNGMNSAGYAWQFGPNADYIRIEGFEIKDLTSIGFFIGSGATHINIYMNKVHDIARRKIACSEGDAGIGHGGVYASPNANNLIFDSNIIYRTGRIPGGCDLHDFNKDHGIYSNGPYGTVINNIFYDNNAGWGVQLQNSADHWNIINNTFYGTNPGRDGHIVIVGSRNDINIQNNISHSPGRHFVQSSTPANDAKVIIRNNLVYGGVAMSVSGAGYSLSNNITGQDPRFVNLTERDFHLQAGSPAVGKGNAEFAPKFDHDRKPRSRDGHCDIGAYEH
jgi:hypothetical protein